MPVSPAAQRRHAAAAERHSPIAAAVAFGGCRVCTEWQGRKGTNKFISRGTQRRGHAMLQQRKFEPAAAAARVRAC